MDRGVIVGLALGTALILMGIWTSGGELAAFISIASMLIVLGGTLAAAVVRYGTDSVAKSVQLFWIATFRPRPQPDQAIPKLVRLAEVARRDGLLAMEDEESVSEDPFLQSGVHLVVDGTNPELVKEILEIEMAFLEERHSNGQGMFTFMGALSPSFGMIGTLIGLVIMLGNLNDPDSIGPGLAVALITTFYGTILANLLFTPVAGRLRQITEHELLEKEMISEALLSIQRGENPRVIERKLKAFLAPPLRSSQRRAAESAAGTEPESVVS